MAITIYNIKKWCKMLTGRSIMHVEQDIGKIFSTCEIKGYYNDLTKKVTEDKENLGLEKLPVNIIETGESVLFPTQIFQYGLGAFDLFLIHNKKIYLNKFKMCLEWAYLNQEESGAWNNFYFIYPEAPYSAMSQGEGASLLLRGFKLYNEKKYLIRAKKAIDFMLEDISNGGTSMDIEGQSFFLEYTNQPIVLNGLIFALFGLYDFSLVTEDIKYKRIFQERVASLKLLLPKFDNGYWSKYNCEKMIASSFYHKLHIAQLYVLYEITNEEIFKDYAMKWEKYLNRKCNKIKAFLVKAFQKIIE